MAISPEVLWLSLGLLLLVVEVITGGFWVGFFGIGAIVAAALLWIGVIDGLNDQLAAFVMASVLPLVVLRKSLVLWLNRKASDPIGNSVGDVAVVVEDIGPMGRGRVEYQGSTWDAETDVQASLPAHTRVRIVRQEGTRLYVRPDKPAGIQP